MTIAIIGGNEGNAPAYTKTAKRLGAKIEYNAGHGTTHRSTYASLVKKADLVVLITGGVAHSCSTTVVDEANQQGKRLHRVQRFGTSQLRKLIEGSK